MTRLSLARTACVALLLSPGVAWAEEDPDLTKLAQFVRWGGVLLSVVVIVGAVVSIRFVGSAADRLSIAFPNRRLLFQKIESFTRFFVYVATGAVVVGLSFRINATVLTLIGGTLAVAVGFAMRDLVAAVIAGITIIIDRPFQVGDRVSYAGEYGDITQIGLRSVKMTTLDDNVVTIPNNKVLTDVTSCGNYGALEMQVSMEFFIGIDQDVDRAVSIVKEALITSRFVHLGRTAIVLIKQMIEDNYVVVRITGKAYVLDTKYEKAFETDVNRRVLRAFRAQGIQPPAMLYRPLEKGPDAPPPPSRKRSEPKKAVGVPRPDADL